MPNSYDVVVLYNSRDNAQASDLVKALEQREVKVWFGEREIKFGDHVGTEISHALRDVRHVIVSVGPNGIDGDYFQKVEFSSILNMAAASKLKVIPIYVGQSNEYSPDDAPEPLLSGPRSIDMRQGVEAHEHLERLVEQLRTPPAKSEDPEEEGAADKKVAQDADEQRIEEMIDGIVVRLEEQNGLMIGIGPHWSGFAMPDAEEVALDLLSRTLDWSAEDKTRYRGAPLVHAETAALSFSLSRKFDQDVAADRIAREIIAPRSLGEPAAFTALARLMKEVGVKSRAEYGRAVVFTTNIDCAVERAFLKSGVPFTLVIHTLKSKKHRDRAFIVADMPACRRDGDGWRLSKDGTDYVARAVKQLTAEERESHSGAYDQRVPVDTSQNRAISLDDYIRTAELNRMLGRFMEENHEVIDQIAPRGVPETPVIVKLLGSHTVPGTALVSSEQHFQLAKVAERISPVSAHLIGTSACLIAGHCVCDPVFRLMFETILREHFVKGSVAEHNQRYALLPATGSDPVGVAALRRVVQGHVAGETPGQFNMRLESGVDPGAFFDRLRRKVAGMSDGTWG